MRVSWERPDYPNGIISCYRVSVGYYESGRGQINTTDTSNTTLSATIQHSSLGECPSEDCMHAPLIPVVLRVGMCSLSSILTLSFQSLVFPTMGVWWPSTRLGRARDGCSCSTPENLVRGCVQFVLSTGDCTSLCAASGPVWLVGDPVRSRNGDAITVWWKAPNPVESRGIITQYQIDFSEATGGSGRHRRQGCQTGGCALPAGATGGCCQVPSDQTLATITGLDSSKAYSVTVSASNMAGQGEKSEPVTAQRMLAIVPLPLPAMTAIFPFSIATPSSTADNIDITVVVGVVMAVFVVTIIVCPAVVILLLILKIRKIQSSHTRLE